MMAAAVDRVGPYRVLISDCEPQWQDDLRRRLQPEQVLTYPARTLEEMLDALECQRWHLAILQHEPPQFDGLQALRLLRTIDERLPCIMLSREVNRTILGKALSLEAFSVLSRPVELQVLIEQMRRAFVRFYDGTLFVKG